MWPAKGFLCKGNTESVEAMVTLALDDITGYGPQHLQLKAPNLPPAISRQKIYVDMWLSPVLNSSYS